MVLEKWRLVMILVCVLGVVMSEKVVMMLNALVVMRVNVWKVAGVSIDGE